MGHVYDGSWAYQHADRQINWAYRSTHVVAIAGKAITSQLLRTGPCLFLLQRMLWWRKTRDYVGNALPRRFRWGCRWSAFPEPHGAGHRVELD